VKRTKRQGTSKRSKWNPRYVAYAHAHGRTPEQMQLVDEARYPGGCMTGFMLWMDAKMRKYHSTLESNLKGEEWGYNKLNEVRLAICYDPKKFDSWLQEEAERDCTPEMQSQVQLSDEIVEEILREEGNSREQAT